MNYVFLLDLIYDGVGLFSLFAIYLSVHSLAFQRHYRRPTGGDARLDFHVSIDFEEFEPGAGGL